MMPYQLIKPLLFSLDPETAHHLTFGAVKLANTFGVDRLVLPCVPDCPRQAFGLSFSNPVGLAAGLDKNADFIDEMAALGFGFIEVGTVTPRPQPGNPKPRLFRLPQSQAIINRMGFNNKGVDHLVGRIKKRRYKGILGVNIGKNFDTPLERAHEDYQTCLRKVYPYADYIVINISSPNTPGLRDLQFADGLKTLLDAMKSGQKFLAELHSRRVPLLVKLAPDLDQEQIAGLADVLLQYEMDGVVATNTTISRDAVAGQSHADEKGGLSGAPLTDKSTAIIRQLAEKLQGKLPIIGVGGIMRGTDAVDKVKAGATLVQLYTGLIYRGPELVGEVADALRGIEHG